MQHYVCGLLFDDYDDYYDGSHRVALLQKLKGPDYMIGKWTGVGGKVEENEIPHNAMTREFIEEAGVVYENWDLFLTLYSQDRDAVVHFFRAFSSFHLNQVKTQEEEQVEVFALRNIPGKSDLMENLNWIIPMALSRNNCFRVKTYSFTSHLLVDSED